MTYEPKPPAWADALAWSHRISGYGLILVLPALAGRWVDRHYGTGPWALMAGAVLGFVAGLLYLLAMVKGDGSKDS